jgi:tRNA (cmo5U34)-methyltransferase
LHYERRFTIFVELFFILMNEFDLKAPEWDKNPMHMERSVSIAKGIMNSIVSTPGMRAMEFGAGTAILSFLLKDNFKEIVLVDSSAEMIRVTNEKIEASGAKNMKTLLFDLEKKELKGEEFDIIFTQMVLHHVTDIETIFERFYHLIKPEGYLAIADLYPEDGSFHGEGFTGHKGFGVAELITTIQKHHFINIYERKCFVIKRKTENGFINEYPVFLLTFKRR